MEEHGRNKKCKKTTTKRNMTVKALHKKRPRKTPSKHGKSCLRLSGSTIGTIPVMNDRGTQKLTKCTQIASQASPNRSTGHKKHGPTRAKRTTESGLAPKPPKGTQLRASSPQAT